jgi:DDE superfamily endonuclease
VVRTESRRQAQRGLALRLLFEEEARFGRMLEPRRAWTPPHRRPLVATRIEREYGYAYAAVSPPDGALVSLVLPEVNAELMSLFLAEVGRRYPREFILMVWDGAGGHRAGDLVIPERMRLYPLPARRPELNPAEHIGEEWREKWMHNRLFPSQEEVERQVMLGLAVWEQDAERVASLAGFDGIRRMPLTTS